MRAVTWQGKRDVRVEDVPDPRIEEPTDAVVRVTTTNICGSDLHLYEPLAAFMAPGDILGHEPMGIVEAVGGETGDLRVGDRVSIPFQISCGHCWMCDRRAVHAVRDHPGPRPGHRARRCSASPSSTVRCPAARRSTCGCRRRSSPTSSCRRVRRTTGSPTCPTSSRRPGRPWSTPPCPTAARWWSSAWARSVTSPAASARSRGTASSASTSCRSGSKRVADRGIEVLDLTEHGDDLGDVIRDLTGRPRTGLGRRRRRHGGPRLAGHEGRAEGGRAAPAGSSPRPSRRWRGSTGSARSTPRSTSSVAVARSRSAASTAARRTRCRC